MRFHVAALLGVLLSLSAHAGFSGSGNVSAVISDCPTISITPNSANTATPVAPSFSVFIPSSAYFSTGATGTQTFKTLYQAAFGGVKDTYFPLQDSTAAGTSGATGYAVGASGTGQVYCVCMSTHSALGTGGYGFQLGYADAPPAVGATGAPTNAHYEAGLEGKSVLNFIGGTASVPINRICQGHQFTIPANKYPFVQIGNEANVNPLDQATSVEVKLNYQ